MVQKPEYPRYHTYCQCVVCRDDPKYSGSTCQARYKRHNLRALDKCDKEESTELVRLKQDMIIWKKAFIPIGLKYAIEPRFDLPKNQKGAENPQYSLYRCIIVKCTND